MRHVTSYENRPKVQQLARQNLEQFGLASYVTFKERDIGQGFDERGVDAIFLDVANPWDYVEQAHAALTGGGLFGSIVPTANQVISFIGALEGARHSCTPRGSEGRGGSARARRVWKPAPGRVEKKASASSRWRSSFCGHTRRSPRARDRWTV